MRYEIETNMKKRTLTRSELKAFKRMFPEVINRINMREMGISNREASRLTSLMVRIGIRTLDYTKDTFEDRFYNDYEVPEKIAKGTIDFDTEYNAIMEAIPKYDRDTQKKMLNEIHCWECNIDDVCKYPRAIKLFLDKMSEINADHVTLHNLIEVESVAFRGKSWSGMAKGIINKWDIQNASGKYKYVDSFIRMEAEDAVRRILVIENERKKRKERNADV